MMRPVTYQTCSLSIVLFYVLFITACDISDKEYDIVIKSGFILDGTASPYYKADIGIINQQIRTIGRIDENKASKIINAKGLIVSPGFIDIHSHASDGLTDPNLSQAKPLISQGVTTAFLNPDGGGPVDLTKQQEDLLDHGLGVNVAQFIGHSAVRREVLGMENRAPQKEELEVMKSLVEEIMQKGAMGLSSGLYYAPGSYSDTEEVVELAKVASKFDGFYSSHIRDESSYTIGVIKVVEEVIEIANKADMPGVITHIKVLGPTVWDKSKDLISIINKSRNEGIEIWADQYPYNASGSGITGALVPRWALNGGHDVLIKRIEDSEIRPQLWDEMNENMLIRRGGADRLQIRRYEPNPDFEGMTMEEIAEKQDVHPIDLAMEMLKKGGASFVSHVMQDQDVENFMRQPWTAIASDGGLVALGEGMPHPRNYGTFPRVFDTFVKERKILSLEEAVRKASSLPARIARIQDRGIIQEGTYADLIVFDFEQFQDKAEYLDPHQLSTGMIHVLVNGEPVLLNEEFTGNLPGKVIKKN